MKRMLAAFAAVALGFGPSSSYAQVRVVVPVAPVMAPAAPLAPAASLAAPLLAPSHAAPTLSSTLRPAALAPALPDGYERGRAFFDGAASTPDRPAPLNPARPERGATVSLNGVELPARAFSDQTSIAGHIIRAIDASRVSIDIALHGLALREVMAALSRAKKRGVRIRIVMNQSHVFPEKPRDTRTPEVQRLIDEGFEMKMLRGGDMFGVMHNKFAVFDGQVVETGSFNWTHAADSWHFENAMFFAERARIKALQAYWDWMWSISAKITAKAPAPPELPAEGAERPGLPPAPQDPERPVAFRGEAFPGQAFSPKGVAGHLIRALDLARESIDLANFSFTSEELRDALLRAKTRGVRVRIVFDADQFKFLSEMRWFDENGFDLMLSHGKDGRKGVMHHKFAVIDDRLAVAGSYNWTRNGEKNNYENAMFLDTPDDVMGFAQAFARVRAQGWIPDESDHQPHAFPDHFTHPDGL